MKDQEQEMMEAQCVGMFLDTVGHCVLRGVSQSVNSMSAASKSSLEAEVQEQELLLSETVRLSTSISIG